MIIIGAGMSGLLAGQFFRSHDPIIIEKQDSLPNNHKALLRFRSDAVSQLTGISFKKVQVDKMMNYREEHITQSNLFLNNLYSQKVTGSIRSRSALKLERAERYIAPEDFIQRVSSGLDISYSEDARAVYLNQIVDSSEAIISTMPVHKLAEVLNYELKAKLETRPIWTVKFDIEEIECDVYQTVYYPNPSIPLYRLSITGNTVIAEFCEDPNVTWRDDVLMNISHFLEIDFGIIYFTDSNYRDGYQKYGKLIEENSDAVKEFLGWATRNYNIYSLGRWGTHRQILMDDVVHDLKVINRMIESNGYKR